MGATGNHNGPCATHALREGDARLHVARVLLASDKQCVHVARVQPRGEMVVMGRTHGHQRVGECVCMAAFPTASDFVHRAGRSQTDEERHGEPRIEKGGQSLRTKLVGSVRIELASRCAPGCIDKSRARTDDRGTPNG